MSTKPRFVSFVEIGKTLAEVGHADRTVTLVELANDPPLAKKHNTDALLSMLVYQHATIITMHEKLFQIQSSMVNELAGLRRDIKSEQIRTELARGKTPKNDLTEKVVSELAGLRRDVKSAQTRVEAARERAAKAEEKAALAQASIEQPPIKMIQAGRSLRRFETQIKRKF